MKSRFGRRLFLFTLPVFLFLVCSFAISIYSGEAMPISVAVALQMADPGLIYMPLGKENDIVYRQLMTEQRLPEILMIGSSRVQQFRSGLFNRKPAAFYNVGGTGWRLSQIRLFIEGLPAQVAPKAILFQIDQSWFSGQYPLYVKGTAADIDAHDFDQIVNGTLSVWQALLRSQISIPALISRTDPLYGSPALGVTALGSGEGFRFDGSFRWNPDPTYTPQFLAQGMNLYQRWMRRRVRMFAAGSLASDQRWSYIESVLQFAKERGIYVIGFSGPYAPLLYDEMMQSEDFAFIADGTARVKKMFEDYGFTYIDLTNPHDLGLTDDQFMDGWHGSEYVTLLEYLALLRQAPDILGPYSDVDALQAIADQTTDPFTVFPPA